MTSTATVNARVREDIVRLVHRGLTTAEFSAAVGHALTRAVPAEGTCMMTVDPATLLPTAEFVENGLPAPALLRLVEIDLREPDVNRWMHLARAERPAASLSEATSGDLERSLRHREIRRPGGFADELRVVLGGNTGTWGQLTVFREANRRYFSAAEVQFASSIAGLIADGLRRSLLLGQAEAGSDDVGLLVLDAADGVTMANQAAQHWLDHLELGPRSGSRLPLVITAVARQARALADPDPRAASKSPRAARARMRTGAGQWLCVRGSMLGEGSTAPTAVMIEPARAAELAPFIVEGYGFTDGERRVTELVAQGLSTKEIAGRLQVTAYTVQDHLKSIFAKSGAGSRGDLVARLFFDHYAGPLVADS